MRQAAVQIREWRENPCKFVWDNFKVEPDAWQVDALNAFASNDPAKRRISLQACVGPGKSTLLAWCGLNFISCYGDRGEHPKGAAMSITADNLKDNLWSEISKWMSKSAFLMGTFEHNQDRLFAKDHPKTWFISARSFSKTADAEEQGRTLSGLHSKYVLYLIDESGDIAPSVLKAAEQGLATEGTWGKIMQAGNPTSHGGILYAAQSELRDMWFIICITSDPDDPKRTPRVSIDWARQQIKQYGRENPWVMSSILGRFPPSSINTLLSPDEVYEAMHRHLTTDKYDYAQKRLGVDVARFGDDSSVIFPRQGLAAFKFIEMRGQRTPDIAGRVITAKTKWRSEVELIDGTGGFGSGVIDNMILAGYSPFEIHFSAEPSDRRYYNLRAEMYFDMAAWVKRGGALPNDAQLAKELVAPTYTLKDGRLLLESKEQIKKRTKLSPDRADALALTFGIPDAPAADSFQAIREAHNPRHKSDYDPFATTTEM